LVDRWTPLVLASNNLLQMLCTMQVNMPNKKTTLERPQKYVRKYWAASVIVVRDDESLTMDWQQTNQNTFIQSQWVTCNIPGFLIFCSLTFTAPMLQEMGNPWMLKCRTALHNLGFYIQDEASTQKWFLPISITHKNLPGWLYSSPHGKKSGLFLIQFSPVYRRRKIVLSQSMKHDQSSSLVVPSFARRVCR
jgi:hypothetical protein